jgi:hypothetical protein
MLLFKHQEKLSFPRFPLAGILTAMTLFLNLNSETAMAKTPSKTPLSYYTTKHKGHSRAFVENYLKDPVSSASLLDQKIAPSRRFDLPRPIIPFQPFIVDMPFDLVLGVNDGNISMIELIKIPKSKTQAKDLWFILESTFKGVQYLGLPLNPEDAEEIKEIAKMLNFKTYQSDLSVKIDETQKTFNLSVSYNRMIEGENKKIEFTAMIPQDLMPQSEQPAGTLLPANTKRLSHGMNHSAASVLALIDIYQTPDFLKLSKIKVKFTENSKVKLQKILGLGVTSPIAQLVMGLGTRKNTYREINKELVELTPGVYSQALSKRMGKLEYHFDLVKIISHDGQEIIRQELREIRLFTASTSVARGKILFNPSLPDLRYELPSGVHVIRTVMALNGLALESDPPEMLNAYVGELRLQNSNTGKGVQMEMRAGDMDQDHRERFKKTPEWTYKRPYYALLEFDSQKQDMEIACGTLAPSSGEIFQNELVLSPTSKLQSIQSSQIDWLIRPHRLSRLVLRTSDKKNLEEKQKILDPKSSADAPAYLLGGTWGNGQAASDITVSNFTQGDIAPSEGLKFYQLTTAMFPMRHNLEDYEETRSYFTGEKAEIVVHALIKIKFSDGKIPATIVPFINGIKFQSAANHVETAVTFNSLAFRLLQQKESQQRFQLPSMSVDSEGFYNLLIEIKKGFGPELTRPYRSPWRQNLESYAGYGGMDIGLITSTEVHPIESFSLDGVKSLPLRIGFPGKVTTRPPQFNETRVAPKYFPISFQVQSLAPANQLRASRYIRSLSLNLPMDQSPHDNWSFTLDNEGEISWKTDYVWSIQGLESNLFD